MASYPTRTVELRLTWHKKPLLCVHGLRGEYSTLTVSPIPLEFSSLLGSRAGGRNRAELGVCTGLANHLGLRPLTSVGARSALIRVPFERGKGCSVGRHALGGLSPIFFSVTA